METQTNKRSSGQKKEQWNSGSNLLFTINLGKMAGEGVSFWTIQNEPYSQRSWKSSHSCLSVSLFQITSKEQKGTFLSFLPHASHMVNSE